jgi:hypothetical protein
MSKNEQLAFSLPASLREGILPYPFAISELKKDLTGKVIRVVHEKAGHQQPDIEVVQFAGIAGRYHTALEFHRLDSGDPRTIGRWEFASPNYGISKIIIIINGKDQGVIYRNPTVESYYRKNKQIPTEKRNELFLKGRWFPPKMYHSK